MDEVNSFLTEYGTQNTQTVRNCTESSKRRLLNNITTLDASESNGLPHVKFLSKTLPKDP